MIKNSSKTYCQTLSLEFIKNVDDTKYNATLLVTYIE